MPVRVSGTVWELLLQGFSLEQQSIPADHKQFILELHELEPKSMAT